jgi:hypothetical protein
MKRGSLVALSVVGIMLLIGMAFPNGVSAEVNVNVGIGLPPPPPLAIPAPPPMFVIPRTYVYFAPQADVDILFYHGYWYRPYRGYWYRSGTYNGKWVYIAPQRVPSVLINLPPDYRRVPPGHRQIPYGEFRKNWKTWDRDKYWDKHGGREWHGEKWEHDEGRERDRGRDRDRGRGRHGD